ncbi:choice-of-anchor R domain-containing protein [Candidatus Poriferisodalis sp.]|uniref:choice-of-anchor R domain-containing protein n=1 Tax=Candidatus Poriferisodalis sp. TaxID=3101277 RepID=UPI003D120287
MTRAIRNGRARPRRPTGALAAFLLLLTTLAMATPPAQAQAQTTVTLVSNAGQTLSGGFSNYFQAQSFTTGSNTGGYTLSEVRIHLNDAALQFFGHGTAVKIRENNRSDQPGDEVALLTNPATLTDGAVNTFTVPANTTLSASTVYWVSVNDGVTGIPTTSFSFTSSNAQTGLAGWSLADTRLSWAIADNNWESPHVLLLSMELKGYANAPPANSAPVFSASSLARSVEENAAAGVNVGAAVPAATDADSGDTLTYTMEGADRGSFSFDAATRRIKTKSGVNYDFEIKNSYSVTIKVSDGTASGTVAVTIALTDAAEAPSRPVAPAVSATSGSTTSLDASWSAPGRDGGPALVGYGVQYRAGSSGVFMSWSHSGTSTSATITGLSAGTAYEVRVRALNGETPSGWSPSGSGRTGPPAASPPTRSVPFFPVPDTDGGGGRARPSLVDFEWTVEHDIESLDGGQGRPTGSWSDGAVFWIADSDGDGEVYAYGLGTGERVEGSEFVLDDANRAPRGLWSRTGTVWVSDSGQDRVFAYDLDSGDRLAEREIALDQANGDVRGIWSDGGTLWVLDRARALFAYDLAGGHLLARYLLDRANSDPRDLWSDGVTVWVSDHGAERLFAYRLPVVPAQPGAVSAAQADSGEPRLLERVPREEFGELSGAGNSSPSGIWSDGDVMYVVDDRDRRVYTYNMPDAIDARLAALWLSGVDFGGFDRDRTDYVAVAEGVTETVVTAEATQRRADVEIKPGDSDADGGHQVALGGLAQITVTVTSADASRTKTYRVAFFAVPADVDAPGLHLAGAHPWVASDCSGDVPIIVASDADAQSDIYSAVTLAGIIGTDCIVLAGAREASMPQSQAARLAAAAHGGYVVGGPAAVPPAKLGDRDMSRIWGGNRWSTAQKVGDQAIRLAGGTPAEASAAQPAPLPADVGAPGLHLAGAHPWVASDCSGDTPIVVASDAKAQSDIYSAVTLAGIIGTDCVILAGAREAPMPHSQATRLAAAADGGYVIGGQAAVPAAKIADRDRITRIAGPNRWRTAQKVGHQARTLTNSTQ